MIKMGKAKVRHNRTSKKGKTFPAGKGVVAKKLLRLVARVIYQAYNPKCYVGGKTGTLTKPLTKKEKGWFGDRLRHSNAKKFGTAGGAYKTKRKVKK